MTVKGVVVMLVDITGVDFNVDVKLAGFADIGTDIVETRLSIVTGNVFVVRPVSRDVWVTVLELMN